MLINKAAGCAGHEQQKPKAAPKQSVLPDKKKKKKKKPKKDKLALSVRASAELQDLAVLQHEIENAAGSDDEADYVVKPAQVEYEDRQLGKGDDIATAGKSVHVSYKGFLSNGKCFDKSKKRPLEFVIGREDVVEGFDDGVLGMRLGGERVITVPPDLAYGEDGLPGLSIPANATLRFEIQMLGIFG